MVKCAHVWTKVKYHGPWSTTIGVTKSEDFRTFLGRFHFLPMMDHQWTSLPIDGQWTNITIHGPPLSRLQNSKIIKFLWIFLFLPMMLQLWAIWPRGGTEPSWRWIASHAQYGPPSDNSWRHQNCRTNPHLILRLKWRKKLVFHEISSCSPMDILSRWPKLQKNPGHDCEQAILLSAISWPVKW